MINAATSLKPALINYGVRFIQKYENSTHIIRLSDNHRESFENAVADKESRDSFDTELTDTLMNNGRRY